MLVSLAQAIAHPYGQEKADRDAAKQKAYRELPSSNEGQLLT